MDYDGEITTEHFSSWLQRIRKALRSGDAVDVPCGDCRGCCTSSYFIHVDANERATLDAVPDELKFAAPGQPAGSVVLGYDRRGQCPLFDGRGCSIYERGRAGSRVPSAPGCWKTTYPLRAPMPTRRKN